MEAPQRGPRPGTREGASHSGKRRGFSPKEKLSLRKREEDPHVGDGWREPGSAQPGHSAQHRKAAPRPGHVAEDARQKRCRSPDGAPSTGPRENGPREEKGRGRPGPAPGAAKPKPESSMAERPRRAGPADPSRHPKNRRTRSRSPAGRVSSVHSQDSLEARSGPCKHRRHLSVPAQEPSGAPWSRLLTHLGALEVALENLRAPGGAFLPLREPDPAGAPEPSASQRAWLTWHLAQAGSSLHWALSVLDSLLAEQPWAAFPTEAWWS